MKDIYVLFFKSGIKTRLVNCLTLYRIVCSVILPWLIFNDHPVFKWILLSAFITDALDGYMARKFNVVTKLGSKLDSLADDFLFSVCLLAIYHFHSEVFIDHIVSISILFFIFMVKVFVLLVKYKKIISDLHIATAKAAAIVQALFFLHCVFFQPSDISFYAAVLITTVSILQETVIILFSKKP